MAEEHMRFDVSALDRASRVFLFLAERVEKLDDKLDELDRSRVDVDVDVDTAAATQNVEDLDDKVRRLDLRRAAVHVASRGLLAVALQLDKLDHSLDHLDGRRVEVDVDVDTDRASSRTRALTSLLHKLGRPLDRFSSLSVLATSNYSRFIRTAGGGSLAFELVLLTLVAAFALLGEAATLAAGTIIFVFGGALAAIGIAVAAFNKKVKNAFSDLKDHVVKVMKEISKPFIDTLLVIAEVARKVFDGFTPQLKKSFELMAPVLARFSRQFGRAFSELGRAFVPVTRAFNALLREIGPRLRPLFRDITDALIEMARWVRRNRDDVADLLFFLLNLIPKIIHLITVLAETWRKVKHAIVDAFTGGSRVINRFKRTFGPIIRDIARLVRENWGPLKDWVRRNFQTIKQIIVNILDIIRLAWKRWGEDILRIVRIVFRGLGDVIEGALRVIRGITKVILGLLRGDWRQVWSGIKDIVLGTLQAIRGAVRAVFGGMRAIIVGIMRTIRDAVRGAWRGIRDAFTAFAHSGAVQAVIGAFNAIKGAIEGVIGAVSDLIGKLNDIPDIDLPDLPNLPALPGPFGRQHGGPVEPGVAYRVGETGEELFVPNVSGRIIPNSQLRGMGGSGDINVEVKALGPRFDLKQVLDSLAWRMAS